MSKEQNEKMMDSRKVINYMSQKQESLKADDFFKEDFYSSAEFKINPAY